MISFLKAFFANDSTMEVITDESANKKIQRRWQERAKVLEELGFHHLGAYLDISESYSWLRSPMTGLTMLRDSEVVGVRKPLRITLAVPVYAHAGGRTYAYVYGLGVMFFTEASNGTIVASATWPGQGIKHRKLQVYKYYTGGLSEFQKHGMTTTLRQARKRSTVVRTWEGHRQRLNANAPEEQAALKPADSMEHFLEVCGRVGDAMRDPAGQK